MKFCLLEVSERFLKRHHASKELTASRKLLNCFAFQFSKSFAIRAENYYIKSDSLFILSVLLWSSALSSLSPLLSSMPTTWPDTNNPFKTLDF